MEPESTQDPTQSIVRPWRTARLPELVSLLEASQILGVSRATLTRWIEDGYMIEPRRTGNGPVWVKKDVERFAEEFGRRRSPRGSRADASTTS